MQGQSPPGLPARSTSRGARGAGLRGTVFAQVSMLLSGVKVVQTWLHSIWKKGQRNASSLP